MRNAASRKWTVQVNLLSASPLVSVERRIKIIRSCGMTLGANVVVLPSTWIFSEHLEIGDDSLVGYHCHIENTAPVTIGTRCSIAQQVTIATTTHEIGPLDRRAGHLKHDPVTIGDGCWIGARAVILPGVVIGSGCVVAAGAVVTKDLDPGGTYGGVPALDLHRLRS